MKSLTRLLALCAVAGLLPTASLALSAPNNGTNPMPVIVVVKVPTPAGVTPERLAAGFEQAVPMFKAAPGLVRKSFTIGADHTFGGVYLWQDRAAADAFYSEAWRSRIVQTYGATPSVEIFEAPISITGPAVATVTER